jgi:tRNA threonylcarbamoyladenosine biosynthesis protein TsaB
MQSILAIDTSTTLASVALLRDGLIISRESSGVQTHSQMILPLLQELLEEAGIKLAQCDAIAFGAGPGSFTGVRTACGIAQGLGFGANLPLVTVGTLETMAEACRESYGAIDVLTVLDAQMGEVYWAQYRLIEDDGNGSDSPPLSPTLSREVERVRMGHDSSCPFGYRWCTVIEPTLSAPVAVMPQGDVIACGNGLVSYASVFNGRSFTQGALPGIMPHARQVARLGQQAFAIGKTVYARDAQPVYLRNKVAFTTAERAAKVAKVNA